MNHISPFLITSKEPLKPYTGDKNVVRPRAHLRSLLVPVSRVQSRQPLHAFSSFMGISQRTSAAFLFPLLYVSLARHG